LTRGTPLKFLVYGLNHVTAPIAVREKFALPPEGVREVLASLKLHAPEAVFLSTCNRVEFYLSSEKKEESLREIRGALNRFHKLKAAEVRKYFYLYEDAQAFLHLFRVAGSLDSMVPGEAQILGQVKEAYQEARAAGMLGPNLERIFSRAFGAAKRVRSQTEIARMPVNVSSVAVDLARKIFTSLSEHRVLILGAGEMGEMTAKYLSEAGVRRFFVANRTKDKAESLAARLGGTAWSLEEALAGLGRADILLTSMGSAPGLLLKEHLERAMKGREGRSLFIIDIGVPRNVDPEAGKVASVYLYNIDDLSTIAESNLGERRRAVEAAESILREEVSGLCERLSSLELVPAIVRFREHFEKIRLKEWEEFRRRNPGLPEKDLKAVERLSRDLVGKFLHGPSARLKALPDGVNRVEYARMLLDLFLEGESGDES
jgi:glutamyl-tRNA reductase